MLNNNAIAKSPTSIQQLIYSLLAHLQGWYRTSFINYFLNNSKSLIKPYLGVLFLMLLALLASKEAQSFTCLVIISWLITVPIMLSDRRRLIALHRINSWFKNHKPKQSKKPQKNPSSRHGLPGSRPQGCIDRYNKDIRNGIGNLNIAIHGNWIPAIPAGMTFTEIKANVLNWI